VGRTVLRIAIVLPVFNDWASLAQLIGALESAAASDKASFSLLVVDDGSTEPATIDYPIHTLRRIGEIEIIRLACNLGHQRAIAVGLVAACDRRDFDAVVVMDSDGEDRPADIPKLLAAAAAHPGHIVCAQRQRRPGLLALRLWYELYKFVFRMLTGTRIDFGNFCLIPRDKVEVLIGYSWIWNHLAGTLARSGMPVAKVPLDRGSRYDGTSKMNFVALIMHGLGAIAVYSDIVMIRLTIGALAFSALMLLGALVVITIKIFTDLATPGWASSVAGLLSVILVQGLMLSAVATFMILNMRSMRPVIPRVDALSFVLSRHKLRPSVAAKVVD
jgi:glycosyltransferase involved in cell wall biosynthesis